jgi:hypothetical protein
MSSSRFPLSQVAPRPLALVFLATLALAGGAAAQATAATPTTATDNASTSTQVEATFPESAFDSAANASSGTVVRPSNALPLLPNRMGPVENILWSQDGLMRKTFNLPLSPEERESELRVRHAMLQAHQVGGFITMAGLLATVTLGQMAYNGHEVGDIHGAVAVTTVASYFTTAALSIFTPPPAMRRDEWNTVSTHKLLGVVHFSGMMLTPILGGFAEDSRTMRKAHLASAYTTTAAFAGALLVVTL